MTSRTAARRRTAASAPAPRRPPVMAIAAGAVAIVVAIGIVVALASDGDNSTDNTPTERLAFAPVAVDGTTLPTFEATSDDPAAGVAAPRLSGKSPDGAEVTVGGAGEPTLVAFLAHWCPHCQRELPLLIELAGDGAFDGVRTVAVLTGTNPQAPNFPPAEWLDHEGWTGDVLVDDESVTAASAYGLAGYPFLVVLDSDGNVVARTSGELPADDVRSLIDLARRPA